MRHLWDVLGVVARQGQPEPLKRLQDIGFRHYRLDAARHLIEIAPGVYVWDWLDKAVQTIVDSGGKVLLSIYGTPLWEEPTAQPIGNTEKPYSLPFSRPAFTPRLEKYTNLITDRYKSFAPNISFGCQTETNVSNIWNMSAEDYVLLVLKPVSEVLWSKGLELIGTGTTLQGERQGLFNKAANHFLTIRKSGLVDYLDVHVYRDKGEDTVSDIKRFMKEIYFARGVGKYSRWWSTPFYITETGFNEEDTRSIWRKLWDSINQRPFNPEEHQREKWLPVLEFLESDPAAENIAVAYAYAGFGGKAGILRDDYTLKPVAEEMKRRLHV